MRKRILALILALVSVCTFALPALAANYNFTDRDGNKMVAPDRAFAAEVVEFTPGSPWTRYDEQKKPENVLGLPDRTGDQATSKGDYCLGAGGSIVLRFNISIYDGEGLDIYIFEVGEKVEDTKVEVSNDLITWYEVGVAKGKTAGVDLAGKVPEGARFRYVRLTDLKKSPTGDWPGADIDAVSGLNVKAISSKWAEAEIQEAEEYGLVPDSLRGTDLTQPITRAEFAAVAVKVFEKLKKAATMVGNKNPFSDCSDPDVIRAYNLGIVNGVGDGTAFAPDQLLTREQAATMLTRAFKRATITGWTLPNDSAFPLVYDMPAPFADDAAISGWARDSVYFMAANGIIQGNNGKFMPRAITPAEEAMGYAQATREQALLIAVRMVKNIG